MIESELLSTKIFLGYTYNWSREIFLIDSVMKTNPWTDKIKESNREKNHRKLLWKRIVVE